MKRNAMKNGQEKCNIPSATARCRHMLRYICKFLCTVDSMNGICTGACIPSCIRSVHVHSMQWTPLAVQSKRVYIPNQMWATPKCRTRQDGDRDKRLWSHIPCLVCRASHMLQQRRFGWWDVLHCSRTLCEQLFPCLVYATGWTLSTVHDNDEPFCLL